jgi:hypothetical protein
MGTYATSYNKYSIRKIVEPPYPSLPVGSVLKVFGFFFEGQKKEIYFMACGNTLWEQTK